MTDTATPARQVDLHSFTPTVDQNPDDIAVISLIDNLVLCPRRYEGEITGAKVVTPRLFFVTSGCLALDICSDGPDRIHSRTGEKYPVTPGGVDYGV